MELNIEKEHDYCSGKKKRKKWRKNSSSNTSSSQSSAIQYAELLAEQCIYYILV